MIHQKIKEEFREAGAIGINIKLQWSLWEDLFKWKRSFFLLRCESWLLVRHNFVSLSASGLSFESNLALKLFPVFCRLPASQHLPLRWNGIKINQKQFWFNCKSICSFFSLTNCRGELNCVESSRFESLAVPFLFLLFLLGHLMSSSELILTHINY